MCQVLLVDTDSPNTQILAGLLAPKGLCLAVTNPGGVALAELGRFQPDLVLPNVVMFGIDSSATCPRQRQQYRSLCAPIIISTEESRQPTSEWRNARGITRSAGRVGVKPLRYDGLRKVLPGLATNEEIEQNSSVEWAT